MLDDLNEVDRFLERHKLWRLTYKEIENLIRPVPRNWIELAIKHLAKKSPALLLNSIKF